MAFLDSGDALVLEKQNGTVRKIVNGSLLPEPLLDVSVATFDTRGMLGIAIAKNETAGKQYIFLYYTEAKDGQGDGEDKCFYSPNKCIHYICPMEIGYTDMNYQEWIKIDKYKTYFFMATA